MTWVSVHLPPGIITISLPPLQANDQTTSVSGATRITEQLNTRVTRGGNTRVTRNYTVTMRPELTVMKLPSSVINLGVPSPRPKSGDPRGKQWR